MDAKLKALKVADLKDILTKAGASLPAKANKADLIAKIIATPAAVDQFNRQTAPKTVSTNDDLLALPEDFDFDVDDIPNTLPPATVDAVRLSAKPPPTVATAATTKPAASTPTAKTSTATTSPIAKQDVAPTPVDEDLEKRKARAARFGVPLVETPAPRIGRNPRRVSAATTQQPPSKNPAAAATANAAKANGTIDDPEKLNARAARFGTAKPAGTTAAPTATAGTGQKRAAPAQEVDAEELERRRKRAERFGTATKA